jgi:hypothetical protein
MKPVNIIYAILCAIPLASCATEPMSGKAVPGSDNGKHSTATELFYNIKPDGSLAAIDAKGNKVKLERVKMPIVHDFKAVERIIPISIIELKGSHYEIICTSPSHCYARYYP